MQVYEKFKSFFEEFHGFKISGLYVNNNKNIFYAMKLLEEYEKLQKLVDFLRKNENDIEVIQLEIEDSSQIFECTVDKYYSTIYIYSLFSDDFYDNELQGTIEKLQYQINELKKPA